ncbi:UV DNA damage repair endonuclease UvsE [Aureimonas pseudogalii]|uniref:UV DNA damage endonuclease n=1 Tax=Aureimonas pseudogalii TaxID=1744844 RepID=A0A7W6EAX7_9HYPH|nr:UV DNA damage repair endonuclease UvsE [Aureimonas pseudogalii]MBB3996701.1 UV DNA damage endonuclease [Aureimonas pseudogalii]
MNDPTPAPARFGFPVKLLSDPALKSGDTRRAANEPHLKVSLELLDAVLDQLDRLDIRMYRLASDIAPYVTHPDMPQFHGMVSESRAELAAFGAKARRLDIRLSFHPSQFIVLNSPDAALVARSTADLLSQAEMLDAMEQPPEAVMVIHVGGTYGDVAASRARWVETYATLPEPVRRRLVLEHDDLRFSAADVLWIHERTGVPLIFDHQHFWCLNPERADMRETLKAILATWPSGVRPKVHFSSPRTEMREQVRVDRVTKKKVTSLVPPVFTGHADFCNPFEFATFMRTAEGLTFDVMLEAKSKDLALMRLRQDLPRYAPDVAARFGLPIGDGTRDADLPLDPREDDAGTP